MKPTFWIFLSLSPLIFLVDSQPTTTPAQLGTVRPTYAVEANWPVLGGPVSPDGKYRITCDLPVSERLKNIGGRDGAGLCVFTTITHSGRWQNERSLFQFQKNMSRELGGGYPSKVDRMLAKYAPAAPYLQVETNDPTILYAAIDSGRMPGVTYNGHDPHYGNQSIAHMVNLIGINAEWAVILDNNYIQDNELVWMRPSEFFKRWVGREQGWAVILLKGPPPAHPTN